ncbi:hypothetical protein [Halorubrum laminariae]|uniref:Small CPxCG-related zinc finger protein n=1 Tax=Halorubrum laminariae TaxID=1433523 RepID=A0ABD6BXW1_9EURY|nr:hypothetical protein [Halorubrum laminariae]
MEANNGYVDTTDGGLFDCPECDVTAPSASVPYDALGYAVCPCCAYSATPRSAAPPPDRRTASF